jgi:integrase
MIKVQPAIKVEEAEMDHFSDHGESQPWGVCRHNSGTQPCPHCQAVLGQIPAFYKKRNLQMAKASDAQFLSRQPIPPEVLQQLDGLLRQAIQSIVEGEKTPILSPTMWDAILILRGTGIRLSELECLKTPSPTENARSLELDTDGSWWLNIHSPKMNKNYRIPLQIGSGVIEAIHRQSQRVIGSPDPLGEQRLFRGLAIATAVPRALRKLAAHITYEGQPYVLRAHQFRYTIALDIFEHAGDLSILSRFLGHTNPHITMSYYTLSSLL